MSRNLPPEFERDVSLDYTEDQLLDMKRRLTMGARILPIMDLKLSFGIFYRSQKFIEPTFYRAYLSLHALAGPCQGNFAEKIGKDRKITDIMYKGWPGAFAWMQYFLGTIITGEQVVGGGTGHPDTVVDLLCQAVWTFWSLPPLSKLIASTPGVWTFIAHLWKRGDESEFSNLRGCHFGSVLINKMLHESNGDKRILDEMLMAFGGKPSAIAGTVLTRLRKIVDDPDFTIRRLEAPLRLCDCLFYEPSNPVQDSLLRLPFVRVIGKVLSRLLDVPFVPDDPTYRNTQRLIALCFVYFKRAMHYANGIPWVLQCLESGILESFVNCCPTLFAYDQIHSAEVVATFQVVTSNLVHLPVAQMAAASHKKLTKDMPVYRHINKAIPLARNAWIRFQCMVLEREEIMSKLPPAGSIPCTKTFEHKMLKKCAGCAVAQYCSRNCQARAWKENDHRTQCKAAKNADPGLLNFRCSEKERYFIMRVAINYAQAKKDLAWRLIKLDCKGIEIRVSHHILPVLTLAGLHDIENGADVDAGRKRDEKIGIRKLRVPRAEKDARTKHDSVLIVDLPTDLQSLPIEGEAPHNATMTKCSASQEVDNSPKEGGSEWIEKYQFYEPSEEPDVLSERKRTTPIIMVITVPVGGDVHVEEFIATDFWSYEAFSFRESEESKVEYKREAGDPDADKYFVRRRGGVPPKDSEPQEDEIRAQDKVARDKEATMHMMLDFTEYVDFVVHQ
ncbi:hypothetical protein SCHPADRAFT_369954 [Schizopora paradoxa]|uniref:MYND-type domain-containing protein n=1 Tax=Schizopora paradoxa TaxID=27342 RepID=A0A0H2RP00_9AGAM|nr:hypothetical protein SCHPADRAFT_369954 [Schizopora paradoxa]